LYAGSWVGASATCPTVLFGLPVLRRQHAICFDILHHALSLPLNLFDTYWSGGQTGTQLHITGKRIEYFEFPWREQQRIAQRAAISPGSMTR
jgi:hypothetical protein